MRYTRFPNRNFLIIVLIQGGYSSAIVGLSVAEKGKLEYAHCHTPIRKVNKGIVRIEQSVEAKMICDANMASPPYLSAKMEVVLPAGIPVIRMQTLTSVESSGNGFSTSQISTGKNTNRKQVYHSTDLENRDRIGASARIVPITIMESGTLAEANAAQETFCTARNLTYTPYTEADRDDRVLWEYIREFMAEGQNFFTYKRKEVKRMFNQPEDSSDCDVAEYVLPLPPKEF